MKLFLYRFSIHIIICNAIALLVLIVAPTSLLGQTFQWVKEFVGSGNQFSNSITTDNSNSIIVTGSFENSIDINPDTSVNMLNSAGGSDAFIAKYDQNGNYLWSHQIGGVPSERGCSVVTDENNNIYLTGIFYNATIDFDPGPSTYMLSATSYNMFIVKYDSSGNFIWAGNIQINTYFGTNSINIDSRGVLYVVGEFTGTADFDPGPGVLNTTSNGYEDAFILKLDTTGNLVWKQTIGGLYKVEGIEIAFNNNNDVFIVGTFNGTVDLDPGGGVYNKTSTGTKDCFIVKLDSIGYFVWAKCVQGGGSEEPRDILINTFGDVVIAGIFTYTVDFDPGPSIYADTSASFNYDFFILNLDSLGDFNWVYTNGDTIGDFCNSIQTDFNNNIYALGGFAGTIDFDKGPNSYILNSNDSTDVYLLKINSTGEFQWVRTFGGLFRDSGLSNAVDDLGNIYSTGYFSGSVVFNPPQGSQIIGNTNDFFITKHRMCLNTNSFVNINSCDSLISPSGNHVWYSSGIYQDTIPNFSGCDSIININLNVLSITNVTISPAGATTFCYGDSVLLSETNNYNSYQWIKSGKTILGANSNNYYAKTTGTYYCIATDQNGCSDTSNSIYINVPCYPVGPNQQKTTIESDPYTLELYPNPTSQNITIKGPNGKLIISNMIGKTLLEMGLNDILRIDLSEYPKGIYFISLYSSQGVTCKKIILE